MSDFLSYRRTIRSIFDTPACLAWVRGASVHDVARAFGGQPEQLVAGTFDDLYEAYELDTDEGIVLLTRSSGWILAVELTRHLGVQPDVLRRLTTGGGEAVALAWTVELDATLAYSSDGSMEQIFDPVRQGTAAAQPEYVAWAREHRVTPDQWSNDWLAAAFALAEAISGVRVDQDWKERTHLVLRVKYDDTDADEVVSRPQLSLKPEVWQLISRHPRIAAIAAAPPEDEFTELSLIAAEIAARGQARGS